jgi:hypothetical protein
MPPHTGKVWLAVKGARYWSGQIRLAVARAGYSRRGKVQPLRVRAHRGNREQEKQPPMFHLAILAVGVYCRMNGSADCVAWFADPRQYRARQQPLQWLVRQVLLDVYWQRFQPNVL